ncbi:MAG: hypothetical protein ACKOYC_05450 [Bacteroidota bacterium]
MITTRLRFLVLLIAVPSVLHAQNGEYVPDVNISVSHNGPPIENPWVGGFNAPIFSEIDMNGDGIKDLFVFDREGYRITTYINNVRPDKWITNMLLNTAKSSRPVCMIG